MTVVSMEATSHPSRVRGLKYQDNRPGTTDSLSHPSRVRGLKYAFDGIGRIHYLVAPFTGAWIEIVGMVKTVSEPSRRTLHGCVD